MREWNGSRITHQASFPFTSNESAVSRPSMPKLAAFPKAWLDDLCVHNTMTIHQWVDLAKTVDVDGLEFYSGFTELAAGPAAWKDARKISNDQGLDIPMLCCSPDFTHPDPAFRQNQIDKQKSWIDMAAGLGATL